MAMQFPPTPKLVAAAVVIVIAANRAVTAFKLYQRCTAFQPRTFRFQFVTTLFIVGVLAVAVGLLGKVWYGGAALTSSLCIAAMLVRDLLLGKAGRKDLDDHWVR